MDKGTQYVRKGEYSSSDISGAGNLKGTARDTNNEGFRYPKTVRLYSSPSGKQRVHPTQKPIELLEWLVKSYSNEGDTILDFTMGSGSTGVACKNTNRNFIGIELDETYYNIAKERMEDK